MSNQMTLFQHETGAGPSRALVAAAIGNELGEGIRSSYAILGIKGGRWHIKYKKNDTVLQQHNPNTGRMEPITSLEMVIVKANGFLNKQYYKGKYVEGNSAPPDCYSLDGKTPSAAVKTPVHSNCTLCPMNQFGSLIGDNGVKQKACRDTKKTAVVPLGDLRNESWGGPMLFRVPPSALGDLSKLADALKARGFPYNAVAVRFSFDLDASHPKPVFNAIRALTDDEAETILELYNSDPVAAILADNDIAVEAGAAPTQAPQLFEQEPQVPVGVQPAQQPAPMAQTGQPQTFAPPPPTAAPAPAAVSPPPQVGPTVLTQAFAPPPPPPGMHGAVVQPFNPHAPPPTADATMAAFAAPPPAAPIPQQAPATQWTPPPVANAIPPQPAQSPFGAPTAQAPVAPKAPRKKTAPVELPVAAVETVQAPPQGQLDADIGDILKGLSAFTGGN